MDDKRFNELVKALASGQSRRGVVKGLAAGLVGGAVGLVRRGGADAARSSRGAGRTCREDANCGVYGHCIPDPITGRKRCVCVNPVCQSRCEDYCYGFNRTSPYQFNQCIPFRTNQTLDCSQLCFDCCIDPECGSFG